MVHRSVLSRGTAQGETHNTLPVMHGLLCPEKSILTGLSRSVALYPFSAVTGCHDNADVISLTRPAVKNPHPAMQAGSGVGSVTEAWAMPPWWRGAHAKRARARKALAETHRTNHIDMQRVVKQSHPASMTPLGRLRPPWTGKRRLSTVLCYASLLRIPPHVVVHGAPQRVRAAHIWISG